MDEILASLALGNTTIYIATLARRTVEEAGAGHMGFNGYFLFEDKTSLGNSGVNILGKASSLEAAFRLADIWTSALKVA